MRSFGNWFFRDRRNGRVVIGQWPNLPLILFAVAAASAWLFDQAAPDAPNAVTAALRIAAGLCLGWWSADELLRGVNPWRRCLGALTLGYVLWRAWEAAA